MALGFAPGLPPGQIPEKHRKLGKVADPGQKPGQNLVSAENLQNEGHLTPGFALGFALGFAPGHFFVKLALGFAPGAFPGFCPGGLHEG